MIVCSFLQDFSEEKGRSLQLICNEHTAFLLGGAELFRYLLRNPITQPLNLLPRHVGNCQDPKLKQTVVSSPHLAITLTHYIDAHRKKVQTQNLHKE